MKLSNIFFDDYMHYLVHHTAKKLFYALGNGDFFKSSAFSDSEALLKYEKWLE